MYMPGRWRTPARPSSLSICAASYFCSRETLPWSFATASLVGVRSSGGGNSGMAGWAFRGDHGAVGAGKFLDPARYPETPPRPTIFDWKSRLISRFFSAGRDGLQDLREMLELRARIIDLRGD